MIRFISAGFIQLLVGPASFSSIEQMNVRSSTLATSVGSEAQWNELGLAVSRVNVPAATSWSVSSVHSVSDPVSQRIVSGLVSAATSSTQAASAGSMSADDRWASTVVRRVDGSATAVIVDP